MTRREKLQEQYEDALFALLMDDLAVEEGKKAYEENERLKADSSFEVPSESRKRCVETIARCCRKKQSQIAITSWTRRGKNPGHGWSRRIYP